MNNRQSGRRRGRNNNGSNNNNNRPQSGGRGGVDQANRIDSRARGNGAQMIEKFRNLARDAQLAGDRVQTEYYLQFADHYFRVVSDFRIRQEEKNAQSGQDRAPDRQREIRGVEDFDGHDDSDFDTDRDAGDSDNNARGSDNNARGNDNNARGNDNNVRGSENSARGGDNNARDNNVRGNRDRRDEGDNRRGERPQPNRNRRDRDEPEQASDGNEGVVVVEEQAPAPRAAPRRGVRRPRAAEPDNDSASIDSAVLPPAIGRIERDAEPEVTADDVDEAPAPKKRAPRRTLATRSGGIEAAE